MHEKSIIITRTNLMDVQIFLEDCFLMLSIERCPNGKVQVSFKNKNQSNVQTATLGDYIVRTAIDHEFKITQYDNQN